MNNNKKKVDRLITFVTNRDTRDDERRPGQIYNTVIIIVSVSFFFDFLPPVSSFLFQQTSSSTKTFLFFTGDL